MRSVGCCTAALLEDAENEKLGASFRGERLPF